MSTTPMTSQASSIPILTMPNTPASAADSTQMPADATAQLLKLQLDSTDVQISGIESKMQTQDTLNTDLGNINSFLSQYSQGVTNVGPSTNGEEVMDQNHVNDFRNTADAKFKQAIDAAGGTDTPEGQQLTTMQQSFDSTFGTQGNTADQTSTAAGTDNKWSVTDISNMTQNVKNLQQSVNTDSQMNMIDLQSLMSQRQTFIQLSTNLLQSQNDATKSIADNIGK